MPKLHSLLSLCIFSFSLIVACTPAGDFPRNNSSKSASPELCRLIQHEIGNTEVCGQPQKVAVLSPHILDNILALGVQPAAYADSAESLISTPLYENPSEQIPYLGRWITTEPVAVGNRDSPSLERLTILQPDLILGEHWQKDKYALLSKIAPTLLFNDAKNPTAPQSWQQDIEGIAQALGRQAQAKALLVAHEKYIAKARAALEPVLEAYPRILLIHSDLDAQVGIAIGSTTGRLLQEIGFEIVVPEGITTDALVSWEIIPQIETQMIMVFDWGDDYFTNPEAPRQEKWARNPLLRSMPVFQQGRVFFVDHYLWGSHTRGPLSDQLILEALPDLLLPSVQPAKEVNSSA
ncbi:MAG: iron-siderophore ABC transporter substrate-binding protein [Cyanobacteria bacterium P01_C01_bin.72]